MFNSQPNANPSAPLALAAQAEVTVLNSRTLFAGIKEILIQHEDQQYRLQLTRSNKLILVK